MGDMPWLRLYTDTIDNEKLRLLAFEDRWHYIAILCLKQQGIIDSESELLERKIAVKMGVQLRELDEIKRRLCDVELIDNNFQPIGWETHQYKSDSAAKRMRKYRKRLKKKTECVTVTSPLRNSYAIETDKDKDKEKENRKKPKRFHPPNLMEIITRCQDKNYTIEPESFFNYYESNGWKIGPNRMKSWEHALAMWESRQTKTASTESYAGGTL